MKRKPRIWSCLNFSRCSAFCPSFWISGTFPIFKGFWGKILLSFSFKKIQQKNLKKSRFIIFLFNSFLISETILLFRFFFIYFKCNCIMRQPKWRGFFPSLNLTKTPLRNILRNQTSKILLTGLWKILVKKIFF